MSIIKRSIISEYNINHLYQIVSDIEKYPEFIKWCKRVEIIEKTEKQILAEVFIEKGFITTSFISRNNYITNQEITMELVKGPLSKLDGKWSFSKVEENKTKIDFFLDLSLKLSIMDFTLKPLITNITNNYVDSFVHRAEELSVKY